MKTIYTFLELPLDYIFIIIVLIVIVVYLKKDNELLKKKNKLNDEDTYRKSVQYKFDNGYEPLHLVRGYMKDTDPTSNSCTDRSFTVNEVDLTIVSNIKTYRKNALNFTSSTNCKVGVDGAIDYASESDIQGFVKDVMYDVLNATGLKNDISMFNEITLTKFRPDIWIVITNKKMPLCVLEVKKPPPSTKGSSLRSNQNLTSQVLVHYHFNIA